MKENQETCSNRAHELNQILKALSCGVCKVRIKKGFPLIYANDYYYSMYGYTLAQAEQDGFYYAGFAVHPDDYEGVEQLILTAVAEGRRSVEIEHRGMCRDGREIWMLVRGKIMLEEPDNLVCVLVDITDRKYMEDALRISEEESRIAFQNTGSIMDIFDVATRTIIQPQSAADDFNLPTEVTGVPESALKTNFVAEESKKEYADFFYSMIQGKPEGQCLVRLLHKDESYHWYSARYTMIYTKDGQPSRGIFAYDDVTVKRERELAYNRWTAYFTAQKENSLAYFEYNLTRDRFKIEDKRVDASPEQIQGTFSEVTEYLFKHYIYEEDQMRFLEVFNREQMLLQYYEGSGELSMEYRRKYRGKIGWVISTLQLISDPDTGDILAFILVKDIDDEKQEKLSMQKQIERDSLTGLLNRATIIKRISEVLEGNDSVAHHALLMLDVDRFKSVNDTYGHQFGDLVLEDVAFTMKNMLRKGDLCGRIGGDEFVIFLRDIESLEVAEKRLQQFCTAISKGYENGAFTSVSIGLASYPVDGRDFDHLYQQADRALYEAKARGRNRYVILGQECGK